MADSRRGMLWKLFHASSRVKIALFFFIFAVQIIAFTSIFHYAYPVLEGKPISWPNALLFVLETITTVGYGDLLPFSNELTILFAIVIMITGILLIFMVIPLLLVPYLSAIFLSTPPKKLPHELQHHVVIVGYGELTKSLLESIRISDLPVLIIVSSPDTARAAGRESGPKAYVIWGDYSEPELWSNAWVKNAHAVILCEDERTNAAIILGIREMVSGKIIAVIDKLALERYLKYAGADYVVSAKHVTGRIIARHAALTTHIDTIIDETINEKIPNGRLPDEQNRLRIINLPIIPGSRAEGKTLNELALFERYGFFTLLISRGGNFRLYPEGEETVDATTMLFLIGNLNRIEKMVREEFMPQVWEREIALIGGFGDVGLSAYHELSALGIECIAIDRKKHGVNQVVGNAEDEATLREAHIEDAKFFIIALNDDDLNIFTTLIARDLNPGIRILARANEPESVHKLYRAGADYVALLPTIGGQIIGGIVLSDIVHVILNLPNGQVVVRKQVRNREGKTTGWVEKKAGVRIIGIEGKSRSVVKPDPAETLREGDALIAVGNPADLKRLIRILQE
ncbi:MAG: NAD-binding protein [Methanoregulaceae archaeon]|nr:NAD-binding protein [Methanoregulaceae archaeon]